MASEWLGICRQICRLPPHLVFIERCVEYNDMVKLTVISISAMRMKEQKPTNISHSAFVLFCHFIPAAPD